MATSPTLKNVAEMAGVSPATASMALNNRPGLSPETRARVINAAEALGYRIRKTDTEDGKGDLSVIGLLTKHDLGMEWIINPFYSRIQLGVANECRRYKISLMLGTIDVDTSNRPVAWPTMINEQRIDGIILAGTFIDNTIEQIRRKTSIPIVLVDSYAPNQVYDSVVTNNIGGAQQAVEYLVRQGHTAIGLAGWNPDSPPSIQQRYHGYIRTLQEYHLDPFVEPSSLSRRGGATARRALMEKHPQITAIFCCNDETAIGMISSMQDEGLKVPDDLSVVGFDDIDLAGEIKPGLTSVHVPKSWMGTIGVWLLVERARNPAQPVVTTVVSTHLVIRDSVKNIQGEAVAPSRR